MLVRHIRSGFVFEQTLIGDYLVLEGITVKGQFRINSRFKDHFETTMEEEVEGIYTEVRMWRRYLVYYIMEGKKMEAEKEKAAITARAETLKKKKEEAKMSMEKDNKILTVDFSFLEDDEPDEVKVVPKGGVRKRYSKKVSSSEGEYGVDNLVKDLGIPANKVRVKLRKHFVKPSDGWKWNKNDYDKVLKTLK